LDLFGLAVDFTGGYWWGFQWILKSQVVVVENKWLIAKAHIVSLIPRNPVGILIFNMP
jgi:hypothetical protein